MVEVLIAVLERHIVGFVESPARTVVWLRNRVLAVVAKSGLGVVGDFADAVEE